MKKTLAASALTLGMLAVPFGGVAFADPTDTYPATYNGSGSDTTEVIMRNLDAAIPALGSWDVTGGVWDTNDAGANCSFIGRVAGSSDGRRALANSVTAADGCFQYARSSSRATSQGTAALPIGTGTGAAGNYGASGTTVPMLPIALGVDGLSYVFRAGSGTPRDLTIGQLRAIYSCSFSGLVDGLDMSGVTIPNKPLLPSDASGTRADWLSLMGLSTTADVASDTATSPLPSCVEDGPGDTGIPGGEFSEHNGNVLTNGRQIIAHGLAQWIAQGRSGTGDFRGLAMLGYINGNTPLQQLDAAGGTLSPSTVSGTTVVDGAWFRTVYNMVPTTAIGDAGYEAIFGVRTGGSTAGSAGPNDYPTTDSGAICTNDSILQNFGFTPVC